MLADDVLGFLFVELLELVVLHVQDHLSAAGEAFCLLRGGCAHAELLARRRLPDLRVLVVLLGDHGHFVGNKEC